MISLSISKVSSPMIDLLSIHADNLALCCFDRSLNLLMFSFSILSPNRRPAYRIGAWSISSGREGSSRRQRNPTRYSNVQGRTHRDSTGSFTFSKNDHFFHQLLPFCHRHWSLPLTKTIDCVLIWLLSLTAHWRHFLFVELLSSIRTTQSHFRRFSHSFIPFASSSSPSSTSFPPSFQTVKYEPLL